MAKLTCTMPLIYQGLIELDTNYGGTENWVPVQAGINNITVANNDSLDQKTYMDGEGFGTTDVIGMQLTLSLTGDRIIGDSAQDFVFDNQYELGCGRKTQCRVTDSEGNYKVGGCTLANITPPGGDAASKGTFSFEIHFNGKPELFTATSAPELSATFAAGSVSGSTAVTVSLTDGVSFGYLVTASEVENVNALAYVNVNAYTSGNDVAVTEGKYFNLVELDSNGRAVTFVSHLLTSLEIAE